MNQNSNSTGIGFSGLLTIMFIALKLTGHLDWSWVWILSPLWISIILALLIFFIVYIFLLIKEARK
jgi:hypothetical protein